MLLTTTTTAHRYPFAYVAFGGQVSHWWTHFLKKGFYHCALLLGNGIEWILVDPITNYTDLIYLHQKDIYRVLQSKGYTLVHTTPIIPKNHKFHIRPVTCVEEVKRFLGIIQPCIWTPYQLYKYLKKQKRKIFLDK